MKIWEVYRYVYGDVCGDSYFGKRVSHKIIGFVSDTEDNVKCLVAKLNEKNHSYYAKNGPEYKYDENYMDEDYITYRELKIETIEEIKNRCKL